jgi:hypothetical protein
MSPLRRRTGDTRSGTLACASMRYRGRDAASVPVLVRSEDQTGPTSPPTSRRPPEPSAVEVLMSWPAALSLGIPALIAVAGYLVTYRNNLRLSERKDRLDWINRQLAELCGPLLATASASSSAWRMFRRQYRPGAAYWGGDGPQPTPDEAAAWRLWMSTVLMPLNRQMRDVIVRSAHLLEEERCLTCCSTYARTSLPMKPS